MNKSSASLEAPQDLPIYPIRTVAQLSGVDARRLRSWESEYQLLHPARTRGGHRLYSPRDLQLILEIRRLVDEEGMSLQGIRGWLTSANRQAPANGQTAPAGAADPGNAAQANGTGTPPEASQPALARTSVRPDSRR